MSGYHFKNWHTRITAELAEAEPEDERLFADDAATPQSVHLPKIVRPRVAVGRAAKPRQQDLWNKPTIVRRR